MTTTRCEIQTRIRRALRQCTRNATRTWVTDMRTGRFVRPDTDAYGQVPAGTEVHTCTQHDYRREATR